MKIVTVLPAYLPRFGSATVFGHRIVAVVGALEVVDVLGAEGTVLAPDATTLGTPLLPPAQPPIANAIKHPAALRKVGDKRGTHRWAGPLLPSLMDSGILSYDQSQYKPGLGSRTAAPG